MCPIFAPRSPKVIFKDQKRADITRERSYKLREVLMADPERIKMPMSDRIAAYQSYIEALIPCNTESNSGVNTT